MNGIGDLQQHRDWTCLLLTCWDLSFWGKEGFPGQTGNKGVERILCCAGVTEVAFWGCSVKQMSSGVFCVKGRLSWRGLAGPAGGCDEWAGRLLLRRGDHGSLPLSLCTFSPGVCCAGRACSPALGTLTGVKQLPSLAVGVWRQLTYGSPQPEVCEAMRGTSSAALPCLSGSSVSQGSCQTKLVK